MLEDKTKKIAHQRNKTPSSEIETVDRYGNALTLCANCQLSVLVQGALIRCLNACHLGDIDYRNEQACAQNNFNLRQITMCVSCGGDGKEYFKEDGAWCVKVCEHCHGEAVFYRKKYSPEEEQALAFALVLDVDAKGWARCPRCHFKFQVSDKNVWQAGRHKRCGQKLSLPESDASI